MPNKKYDFIKLLKEYNKKHQCSHKLNSKISKATVSHSDSNSNFRIRYVYDSVERTYSLSDFVYYNVNPCPAVSSIVSFILAKEEPTLNLRIEILPSNKIRYAYLRSNYFAPDAGNLGKSCMRLKEMQITLNCYIVNKVKIVVVVDDNNKIHARALLWDGVKSKKLKNPFTYLDRVYARSDTLLPLFYDLVEENKWKQYPTTSVNCMDKNYYKEDINVIGMCHLPFMDTFRYLYHKDNLLTASTGLGINKDSASFTTLNEHTNRGYYPSLDPDRVTEAISGNYISKKDAVFIKRYDGYVLRKNIADINGDYYSVYDNTVTSTKLDGYILKENSVPEVITQDKIDKIIAIYSKKYNGFIHGSNAVHIQDEIYHKEDVNVVCFNGKWYHISQCFINYDRKEVNKELAEGLFYSPEDILPYWVRSAVWDTNNIGSGITREGNLIPKERAIIAYDLAYNPTLDEILYQERYYTNKEGLTQLNTGEFIVNSSNNRKYLKKFNNKYYIKRDFKLSDKKQLTLF